jgi:hypothetical protein
MSSIAIEDMGGMLLHCRDDIGDLTNAAYPYYRFRPEADLGTVVGFS